MIAAKMNRLSMIEIPLNYRGRVGESKITGSWSGTWKTGIAMIRLILSSWPGFATKRFFSKNEKWQNIKRVPPERI